MSTATKTKKKDAGRNQPAQNSASAWTTIVIGTAICIGGIVVTIISHQHAVDQVNNGAPQATWHFYWYAIFGGAAIAIGGLYRLTKIAHAQEQAAIATASVEEGWYADPAMRASLRWWDGATWTQLVRNGTEESTDPLPAGTYPKPAHE